MRRRLAFAVLPILALAACQATPRTPELHNVYFTAESAALDDSARNTIAGAAREANASPATFVKVRGFAAPDTGTAAYIRALAEARARAVAEALISGGVLPARIRIEPRGAVPYSDFPTESRRVEIQIGS